MAIGVRRLKSALRSQPREQFQTSCRLSAVHRAVSHLKNNDLGTLRRVLAGLNVNNADMGKLNSDFTSIVSQYILPYAIGNLTMTYFCHSILTLCYDTVGGDNDTIRAFNHTTDEL